MMKEFWRKSFPVLRNKYVITLLVFGLWLLLFDQNNWLDRMSNKQKLNDLKAEKTYYKNKIQEDQRRLEELQTDKDNLEKFAREQYLMKRDNEDVFIVTEEE